MSPLPSRPIYGQPNLSAERVRRAMADPNIPTACPACGSVFLLKISAGMFTSGQSGFRSVSTIPLDAYLCICGEVIMPPGLNSGLQAGGERDMFAQSIQAAIKHRRETDINAAARAFASVEEVTALKAEVASLKASLDAAGVETIDAMSVDEEAFAGEGTVPAEQPDPNPGPTARPRSEAGATESMGEGVGRLVTPPVRPPRPEGGAKAAMKRQGK